MPAFYARVRELAARPKRERDLALDALARRAAAGAMSAQQGSETTFAKHIPVSTGGGKSRL